VYVKLHFFLCEWLLEAFAISTFYYWMLTFWQFYSTVGWRQVHQEPALCQGWFPHCRQKGQGSQGLNGLIPWNKLFHLPKCRVCECTCVRDVFTSVCKWKCVSKSICCSRYCQRLLYPFILSLAYQCSIPNRLLLSTHYCTMYRKAVPTDIVDRHRWLSYYWPSQVLHALFATRISLNEMTPTGSR
jgi:hypothetical protein